MSYRGWSLSHILKEERFYEARRGKGTEHKGGRREYCVRTRTKASLSVSQSTMSLERQVGEEAEDFKS